MSDAEAYRTKDEVAEAKNDDPILLVKNRILENNWATESELEEIENKIKIFVDECENFAEESPFPDTEVMYKYVYSQTDYPFLDKLEK